MARITAASKSSEIALFCTIPFFVSRFAFFMIALVATSVLVTARKAWSTFRPGPFGFAQGGLQECPSPRKRSLDSLFSYLDVCNSAYVARIFTAQFSKSLNLL